MNANVQANVLYQQRVIEEHAALVEKLQKLAAFTDSERFKTVPTEDRVLLLQQWGAMSWYAELLEKRIARFEK